MFISLSNSRSNGFKKWSDQHPHGSQDDAQLKGATPIVTPLIGGSEPGPSSADREN